MLGCHVVALAAAACFADKEQLGFHSLPLLQALRAARAQLEAMLASEREAAVELKVRAEKLGRR